MIEIIIEEVEMPPVGERRFTYTAKNWNDRKWDVLDNGVLIQKRPYREAAIIAYNLNKKYYRENPEKVKEENT